MASGVLTRTLRALGARDPARERLRKTVSVTTGILCSVLWGYGVVSLLHADHALLTMSMFLSLMSGLFVKDSTARARVVTTALLVPTVVIVPLLATALQSQRGVQLVVFVLISGIAVWVRRYGARATALGTLTFFAYFFTLFIHPAPKDLLAFCLIMAGAAGMQLLMKLIMWLRRHPERELGIMLRELRVATAAALDAAATPARAHSLRARLDRVDTMWRSVTGWQNGFSTSAYTNSNADTLALRVMDACVHTEEACRELSAAHGAGHAADGRGDEGRGDGRREVRGEDDDRAAALAHALATLDERASAARLASARDWADAVVTEVDSDAKSPTARPGDLTAYRLAECVLAHSRLRELGLHPRRVDHAQPATGGEAAETDARAGAEARVEAETVAQAQAGAAPRSPRRAPRLKWTPWRDWTPTSRLAIQAMTATTLATVVGEAISASRWYWAVLTAFVVFLSTTTRSGILTRAYRRILGTVLGLLAGIALVFLAHDSTGVLLAICLVCVMGMIYFAPLNYLYASLFITTMLVAIYDMLGVLHGRLLVVRLEETVAGCVCGVICAYLLLSTTSRPALVAGIDAYSDAVDDLLRAAADLPTDPAETTGLLSRIHAVEQTQADVQQTISAMSAALVVIGRERVDTARSLMGYSSRSAVRFGQIVISGAEDPATGAGLAQHRGVVRDAVDGAREAAALARRRIDRPDDPEGPTTTTTTTSPARSTAAPAAAFEATSGEPATRPSPDVGDPTVRSALISLARFTWVMHRLTEVLAPAEDRMHTRARAHAL